MNSSMSILQRIDRLEHLLQFLEEKHSLSSKHFSGFSTTACEGSELTQERDSCKSMASAIEEVKCKGTLIERVAMLESRFLQLSLEIALENASSSSCSTTLNELQEYECSKACLRKPKGLRKRRTRNTTIVSIVKSREWLRWPRMGC